MKFETSSGAVVYTKINDVLHFVIVKSLEGFYGFPKGHIEPGESEQDAALREIMEETGLQPQILPGFRTTDEHPLPNKPGIMKQIIYFLAEYSDQNIKCQQEELSEVCLMTYEKAMDAFQFESSRRILKEANEFLAQ